MARTKQTARGGGRPVNPPQIGCWYPVTNPSIPYNVCRSYLPLLTLEAHTIITDVSSRTRLTQTFDNKSDQHLTNVVYSFPVHDGASVVSFTATIGDVKIEGVVKDKLQASLEFKQAVAKGESAALLEELPEASDVFTTHIGNVPADSLVTVELIYIEELNHDVGADGSRFMIPLSIAPRYGVNPDNLCNAPSSSSPVPGAISFTVDVQSPNGCPVQSIQSPSHPIMVTMGRTTDMPIESFVPHRASASLSLNCNTLDKDFVVIVNVKDANLPRAILETHPTIPNQRALLVSLAPKFELPSGPIEIVFIIDRSGSMNGKMNTVIQAMNTMLKSLNTTVKFNICSFGSGHSFLWPQSKAYNGMSLEEALEFVEGMEANFGGTEMIQPVQATISQSDHEVALNAIILTDGEIWDQAELFKMIRESSEQYGSRFFSLGIGNGASTSLVQGIAIEGNGISQFVADGEAMDNKLVRLLKGALSPSLSSYSLDTKWRRDDEDYEIIESKDASKVTVTLPLRLKEKEVETAPADDLNKNLRDGADASDVQRTKGDRFSHLPQLSAPPVLQVPSHLPPLYPFTRTTMFLMLDPKTYELTPESVILKVSSENGPITLEIEVVDIGKGEMIHQLAARKAVSELEKGHGWLNKATEKNSNELLKTQHASLWDEIVQREAIRLGTKYQIAGKWCSFIAVQGEEAFEPITFKGPQYVTGFQTGGLAPRRQLASKAARKSAPSTAMVWETDTRSDTRADMRSEYREPDPRDKKMRAIIKLQNFDGSWEWEQSLLDITGADLSKAKTPIQESAIAATALAIAFFRIYMHHAESTWELIVEKGVSWLDMQENIDSEKEIDEVTVILP
ncbi:von Willebrand factor type A domain-containing protein [Xylaria arbuscula]|nr:von Willebrand factor type A domain-containing protein [Xylaria arbuscula]